MNIWPPGSNQNGEKPEGPFSGDRNLNVSTVPGQLYRDMKTVIADIGSGIVNPKYTWLTLLWMIEQVGFHHTLLKGSLRELHAHRRKVSLMHARAERSLGVLSHLVGSPYRNLEVPLAEGGKLTINTALSLPCGSETNVVSQRPNLLTAPLWAIQQVGFYHALGEESLQESSLQLKRMSMPQESPERAWSLWSWWSGEHVRGALEIKLHEAQKCDAETASYLQTLQQHRELALQEKISADQFAACTLELAQEAQRIAVEKSSYLKKVQHQENLAMQQKQLTEHLVARTEAAALDAIQVQATNCWLIRWLSGS
jgi:hypothetical protein